MRRLARSLVALVALSLLTSTAAAQTTLESERAQTQQQREVTEDELAEARAAEGDARARLEAADAAFRRAAAALAAVEAELAQAIDEQEAAVALAEELRRGLAELHGELDETEAQLDEVKGRLDARVIGAFKRGPNRAEAAFVSHVLGSDDIGDALAAAPFLTAVVNADRRAMATTRELLGDIQAQRAEVAALRTRAESEAREAERAAQRVAAKVAEQERLAAELAAIRAEQDAAHEALVNDRKAIEEHLAAIERESARLDAEIAELARRRAEEARQREEEARRAREAGETHDPPPSAGPWGWPAACGRVTSYYGSRWGRMHSGVDIACTRVMGPNPPIYASRGGVIASIGCGSGYGVCLIVDHLDGDLSLYAHMSSVAVGPGQNVNSGQVIGFEGSTGNSTGPHLHFEIWRGGQKTDPCPHIGC